MHIFLSHCSEVMKSDHHLIRSCPGRVVDILEACGAFDPGSSPGRGVLNFGIDSAPIFFDHLAIQCNMRANIIKLCDLR
jgi:hypothetical protein